MAENSSEETGAGPEAAARREDRGAVVKPAKNVKSYPRKQSRTKSSIKVKGSTPKHREHISRWFGWGYKDSGFEISKGSGRFTGDKYQICNADLAYFHKYIEDKFNYVLEDNITLQDPQLPREHEYPKSKFSKEDLEAIESLGIDVSDEGVLRLTRSEGQATDDVWKLKKKMMIRIPDAVAWPTCHEEVVELVKLADQRNFVIIPFGGGTSVVGAVECPRHENRPILSLDTSEMNEILWVDHESLVVCAESGIVGQDLERELKKLGYTTGHEPDSIEFSTLGGWVATRASGMKKNKYGNIEDLLVHVRMVTPRGVLEKGTRAPRVSGGPDFNHIILGSEGCLGVITEVALKIQPFPAVQHYGSLVFPDFQMGIKFMREVAKRRLQPASIRLMDHEQFQMGLALRPKNTFLGSLAEGLKLGYLEKIKGFSREKMCLATICYEGDKEEVMKHEEHIHKLAQQMGGVPSGANTGKRGYMMTYAVAYIRDIGLECNVVSDSIETSLPWGNVFETSQRVRQTVTEEAVKIGALGSLCMMRIAQIYDTGCCLYTYFGLRVQKDADVIAIVLHMHNVIRETVLSFGGSVSHHHGIGKLKMKFYETSVSAVGVDLFRATKAKLDPNNIFGVSNMLRYQTEGPGATSKL